ncbi:thioredoxin-like protein [Mycotypha africana]|uniref:thioredoxin-like protein n=1 Tax=Mycotypha africana TaxID=64632 RepID=UPI0023019445|nr:thioredoxin-like protein [Mycotypha africana]KAI8973618.1 thioredoxin-like protein [Mycotypha africana]
MKTSVVFSAIACFLSATATINASPAEENGVAPDNSVSTSVLSLTSFDNFKEAIQSHDLTMVKFFSPQCRPCQSLAPEFEAAAKTIQEYDNNDHFLLAEVDCTTHGEMCAHYQVNIYPTMQVFRKGQPIDIYSDAHTSQRIVEYMNHRLESGLSVINNKEELEQLKEKEPLLAVAYVNANDKEMIQRWSALSDKLIDDFAFGIVIVDENSKEDIQQMYPSPQADLHSTPTVVLMKRFDKGMDVYDGDTNDPAQMEDFIKLNSIPLLGDINPDTFMDYVDAARPLVYLFSDSDEMKAQLTEQLKPLAEKYKGVYAFAHIDAKVFASQAGFLGLENNTWPAIAIHDFKTGGRYPFKALAADHISLSPSLHDDLDRFLDKVHQGDVHELIRSAAIPDPHVNENAPVKTVVAKEFEKMVMDPTKDVLIEVYAPWCPHCQNLAPVYQRLGEIVQEANHKDDTGIVIAKMDGTTNDIPLSAGFQVNSYPTIKLFKAETNEMIDYTGPRTLRDFGKFILEHATKQNLQIDLDGLEKPNTDKENYPREEL